MIAAILSSLLFTAEAKASGAQYTAPAKYEAAQPRPWVVKAASDQIVNMCFWGAMCHGGGGYTTAGNGGLPPVAFSTITFSSEITQTYETDTATTIITTIPGGVVTVYGSATDDGSDSNGTPVTVPTVETDVITSLATPTFDSSLLSPTAAANSHMGLIQEIRMIESYAHQLAEAIIAPSSMTAMLEGAYKEIMERGYIHATKASELVSQASGAMKQLETDPAYKSQRQALIAAPTPARFNVKNIMATLTQTHAAGLAKMTSEPKGKQAFSAAKELASHFFEEFVR